MLFLHSNAATFVHTSKRSNMMQRVVWENHIDLNIHIISYHKHPKQNLNLQNCIFSKKYKIKETEIPSVLNTLP